MKGIKHLTLILSQTDGSAAHAVEVLYKCEPNEKHILGVRNRIEKKGVKRRMKVKARNEKQKGEGGKREIWNSGRYCWE